MGSLHWLTGGLRDLVLHIGTGDLSDGVAVLDLNGDNLDLGVIHTVLSGDLTASVFHSGGHRVGNSMGSDGGNMGSSKRGSGIRKTSEVLGISISLSLSFTLNNGMVATSYDSRYSRLVTDGVNNLLADLLIFNLLSLHCLCGAYILSGGYAMAGGQDLIFCYAVGSGYCMVGGGQGSSQVLGVSLGISLRLGGGTSEGQEARNGKYLHLV